MDTVGKILTQSKGARYFFYGTGAVFTGITAWAFVMNILQGLSLNASIQGIPTQLMEITLGAWGFIWGGFKAGTEKVETMTGIDLDKNGTVGTVTNWGKTTEPATVQAASSGAIYVPQEVASYDAECDASKYSLC